MKQGIPIIVYPVTDLARAKTFFTQWLGVAPYVDSAYYVGYHVGDQEVGLDPHGQRSGQTGPIAYRDVADIQQAVKALLDAGGQTQQAARDVGGGLLVATVKDADGNLIGFRQQS